MTLILKFEISEMTLLNLRIISTKTNLFKDSEGRFTNSSNKIVYMLKKLL